MGLFDFISQWVKTNKIRSLESQVQQRPTPQGYKQLADAYREAGNTQEAAKRLRLGAVRFPNHPEIVRLQAEAEKTERQGEKKRLIDKIQTHPNPILYARLAELYKVDGQVDQTLATCQKGIKAFPKYGGTYLVLGQILVEKKEWNNSVAQLEKSVELDKYNYLALKLLAQVYMELGRPADAVKQLEAILYFAPGDEAILELLKKSKEAAGQPAEKKTTLEAARASDAGRTTIRRFVEPGPGEGVRKTTIHRIAQSGQRDRALNEGLSGIRGVNGVTGVVLVDQYGLVVAASLVASLDEALAGALITNIYRATSGNAAKLTVGLFEEGLVEGSGGNIHIVRVEEMILAVFAQPGVKMGLLEKSIRDFASTVLQRH
jgi:predicted regulator of Ras-like GTPase activity (Roadblock/LC7/MglB family)/cytochrome c-type biogenesis protein CcmH/NrfG